MQIQTHGMNSQLENLSLTQAFSSLVNKSKELAKDRIQHIKQHINNFTASPSETLPSNTFTLQTVSEYSNSDTNVPFRMLNVFYRIQFPLACGASRQKEDILTSGMKQPFYVDPYLLSLARDTEFNVLQYPVKNNSSLTLACLLKFFSCSLHKVLLNPCYTVVFRFRVPCDAQKGQPFHFVWIDLLKYETCISLLMHPPNCIYLKVLILPTRRWISRANHSILSKSIPKHSFIPRISSHSLSTDMLNKGLSNLKETEEVFFQKSQDTHMPKFCEKKNSNQKQPAPLKKDIIQSSTQDASTVIPDSLKQELDHWCLRTDGSFKDVRVLLGSLSQVLWKECKWKPIPFSDVLSMDWESLKKRYRQFLLLCHPDKHRQSTVEVKYRAHRIFQALNEAYHIFQKKL